MIETYFTMKFFDILHMRDFSLAIARLSEMFSFLNVSFRFLLTYFAYLKLRKYIHIFQGYKLTHWLKSYIINKKLQFNNIELVLTYMYSKIVSLSKKAATCILSNPVLLSEEMFNRNVVSYLIFLVQFTSMSNRE